ncbi:MAG: aspartate-semialdehyde dehydrogenase [Ruminococcaceae bacterium]|jgi:aspartate-semialdehyde dehydrogenase|nr:aspartate-semialdehyde dehydrogenase [Oscillospiraceae bacterium]
MKTYNVGILGATGAVGQEMMKILLERRFPVGELRLLASARSAGKEVAFGDRTVTIQEASDSAFDGLDFVLGAAENDISKRFAPAIKKSGAVYIDNSSAFRLDPDIPLVVPEINPEDALRHNGIIANPNCSTIIALMALYPIAALSPIKTIVASTYQAVSGAGVGGIRELEEQTAALSRGETVKCETFPYQIAQNLIPQIGGFNENGYTTEEMKMQNEGRKILHAPEMLVSCTCVRVPVVRSHSIALNVVTERPVSPAEAAEVIAKAKGIKLTDDPQNLVYPMPLDTSDQDLVFVGRIRRDLTNENGLCLWCCGDQIRKGAAGNAVQIAELLIANR